jgi:hypothetical protein
VFHRDLSVNVLGDLPPRDVALIDGDHNWYTVFMELNMLTDVARRAEAPTPVMSCTTSGGPTDGATSTRTHRTSRRSTVRPGAGRAYGATNGDSCRGRGGLTANLAHSELEGVTATG